jgi:predicted permease
MLSALTTIATAQKTSAVIPIESVQHWFACSGLIFLAGVFLALFSMFFFSVSRENWDHFWENAVSTGNKNYNDPYAVRGTVRPCRVHNHVP